MQLFIVSIIYFINEIESTLETNCLVYAILFNLLYHIIDEHIGFYRTVKSFNKKYKKNLKLLTQKKAKNDPVYIPLKSISISDAYSKVTKEDCLIVAEFLISQFEFHGANNSVIHNFSVLENCLRLISHLNTLLGSPYEDVDFSKLLN